MYVGPKLYAFNTLRMSVIVVTFNGRLMFSLKLMRLWLLNKAVWIWVNELFSVGAQVMPLIVVFRFVVLGNEAMSWMSVQSHDLYIFDYSLQKWKYASFFVTLKKLNCQPAKHVQRIGLTCKRTVLV